MKSLVSIVSSLAAEGRVSYHQQAHNIITEQLPVPKGTKYAQLPEYHKHYPSLLIEKLSVPDACDCCVGWGGCIDVILSLLRFHGSHNGGLTAYEDVAYIPTLIKNATRWCEYHLDASVNRLLAIRKQSPTNRVDLREARRTVVDLYTLDRELLVLDNHLNLDFHYNNQVTAADRRARCMTWCDPYGSHLHTLTKDTRDLQAMAEGEQPLFAETNFDALYNCVPLNVQTSPRLHHWKRDKCCATLSRNLLNVILTDPTVNGYPQFSTFHGRNIPTGYTQCEKNSKTPFHHFTRYLTVLSVKFTFSYNS